MASVNDLILSEAIRHMVALQRYDNGVVARIIALLNRSDQRLMAELAARLEALDAGSFTMQRLESLLTSIWALNSEAYAQLGRTLTEELKQFVPYEVSYQEQMLKTHVPVGVHVAAVSAEQVYAAALSRPFQGVLLQGAWSDLDASKLKRVRQAIAQGFVEGKTTDQIIRELRGTRVNGYIDGLIQKDRRDIEAVVRTALAHTAGVAQDNVMEANADLIKAAMWSSTLDLRTSPMCRIRDRLLYTPDTHKPIDHKVPWLSGPGRLHWRCRSGQVPVLKSYRELGIDLPEVEVNGRTRASMDGQVPKETSYAEWLKNQSMARQTDVLGETRARLMRDGKLSMDAMYDSKGRYLTLDELRQRDAEAFKRAGLGKGSFEQPQGLFTIYDAAYPKVKPDISTPARVAAVKLEEAIRSNGLETGAFIASDGRVLVQKTGKPDRLSFTGSELSGTDGSLFTHNHPGNGTFSRADVIAAVDSGLTELRAIGPTMRHILQPGSGWPSLEVLEAEILRQSQKSLDVTREMVNRGELELKFASAEANHQLWALVAKALGLRYTRERS